MKSTPTRGVKQILKPNAYKQLEGSSLQSSVAARESGMTERAGFEELDVYRRAYGAALRVHALSLGFPAIERYALADQMRRASRSICANIAEGHGRTATSRRDARRFLGMAASSADEMRVWASFARDLGCIDARAAAAMIREYREIARMLQGLSRSWGGVRATDD